MQSSGGGVPVHPGRAGVEQDRPACPFGHGAVDRSPDRWWQWDERQPPSLAEHPEDTVPVFLAHVGDVCAGGFEDPQSEQAKHGDQGEVVEVGGLPGGAQQCFELQVRQAQGGTFGRRTWSAGECFRIPSMTQVR